MEEVMFGRYEIIEPIGSGSFGEVYKVRHLKLNTIQALKCIHKGRIPVSDILREADILKNLRHPAIPIIYDIEEDEECVCIIEEYVEGLSLKSITENTKFTTSEVISIAILLCEVVEYLHKAGVVHLDIKPSNIIYKDGALKLLDYGSASISGNGNMVVAGTKWYAAPEMYEGKAQFESDIYSIGITCIMLLCNGQENLSGLDRLRPQGFGRVLKKCIRHSAKKRYGSVLELKSELLQLNKITETKQVSLHIAMLGAYEHAGVTHCAVMAAVALSKMKYSCVYQECNENREIFDVIQSGRRITFKAGVYQVDGLLNIIPWYCGMAETKVDKDYSAVISDYGVINTNNIEKIVDNDIICIVTGCRARELSMAKHIYKELINMGTESGKIRILVNFASAKTFDNAMKILELPGVIRVEFCPEPLKISTRRNLYNLERITKKTR